MMKTIFFLTALLIAIVAVACDHNGDCGRRWGHPGPDEHQHETDGTQISHCHKDGDYPHAHDWRRFK